MKPMPIIKLGEIRSQRLPNAIRQAQPPLEFLPPALSFRVLAVTRMLLPLWMRHKLHVVDIEANHIERLVELYHQFQNGKVRILLAFRHPTTDDPFAMAYLLWRMVPKAARRVGIKLKEPIHSHFIYDRGISLWAGTFVNWLFPRLGGTPIFRGKADRQGLKSARDLLVSSVFPLSVAPEGGTNDHSERVGVLEPGVAQLGFWCAEDIHKAGRSEETFVVPIGIQYSYIQPPWAKLEALMGEIEQSCGLAEPSYPPGLLDDPRADALYGRLLGLGEHLLKLMEGFYKRFDDDALCPVEVAKSQGDVARNEEVTARLRIYLEAALKVAEHRLGVKPQGNCMDRCRRLEQAGWDRIFREDVAQLSPIERGMADWMAEDASLALWHMRLAERLTVITGNYIIQKPSADRFAEMLIILWRITTWLEGRKAGQVPNLGAKRLRLTVGEPISVTQRYPRYQENRRSARAAVQQLTDDLQQAMVQMIR
ncbi:1-acyl-sn-glycerol-3-phosphate acyltransferase [Altericista sp. CCNU0014]|uniref:1-acyl-sn-glycerol-3-phosphate acyltransferase n=1 Tax=Altericista sp. CCNU0014 TaxID=3082949 RepID=UPI00384C2CB3